MMKKFCVILTVLFCTAFSLYAQQRGGLNVTGEVEIFDGRKSLNSVGKQWAIFIAIDNYREWEPLLYPVRDAQEIKNILLEHYYIDEVRELYNREATAAAIRRLFIELQDKTAPNDSVFIFHAGHGTNEDRTKTPAWIPHDGGEDIFAQSNWLSHLQIRSMLDSLRAKHVFLISDSCYSGDLLDGTRGTPDTVSSYPTAYDRVSRQAMSSGASEAVADESEFASRLKSTLLRTETPYITPDFLLSQIKEVQTVRQLHTIPLLAAIPRSSHQLGGSFLFFRKNPSQNVTVISSPSQETTRETSSVVVTNQPPAVRQGSPGEFDYFIGSWIATIDNNNSFDTYEINFSANGRCTVKLTNDIAVQETNGNWEWDGTYFKLNARFRNAPITYQQNIQWVSIVNFGGGNNSFNILGKAATNGPPVRFTFFRD